MDLKLSGRLPLPRGMLGMTGEREEERDKEERDGPDFGGESIHYQRW